MNAPNKIYVDTEIIAFYDLELKGKEDTEYIRKDALLDIIETARHSAIVQRNFNNAPTEQEARIDAYDFIIEQINSL